MPKPVLMRIIITVLLAQGFVLVSQKGSHAKFRKGKLTVIVPKHGKEVPYGTFTSILRQSFLREEDFRMTKR